MVILYALLLATLTEFRTDAVRARIEGWLLRLPSQRERPLAVRS
jgi:hypothetical protein